MVATRDHHVDPGAHFSTTPDFVDTWPPHCRAGTPGASFHPDLDVAPIEAVFDKGAHAAAYSGFEGAEPGGTDLRELAARPGRRRRGRRRDRHRPLRARHRPGRRDLRLPHAVLLDLCAGVAPETTAAALERLREAGVELA